MSDSEYSSDNDSLSSLHLNDDKFIFSDSDYDSDGGSLSSLNIGDYYNNGGDNKKSNSKIKSNSKSKKKSKSKNSLNLSRDDNTTSDNSDDDESDFEYVDPNEELLKDDDEQIVNSDNSDNSDNDIDNSNNNDDENNDETDLDNETETETETEIKKPKNNIDILPINNHPIIVDKKNRISRPYLTKYEYVRCLGERTQQITAGAKVMIKNADELLKYNSPEDIAKLEIKEKCCPYIIVRPLPNNKEEHWDINELEILFPII